MFQFWKIWYHLSPLDERHICTLPSLYSNWLGQPMSQHIYAVPRRPEMHVWKRETNSLSFPNSSRILSDAIYRLRRRTYRCWNRRTATQDGSKNQNLGTSRPRSFSVSVVSMIKTHRFPGDTPILVYILLLQFPYKVVPVVPHNWLTWFITLITMVYGRYIYTY